MNKLLIISHEENHSWFIANWQRKEVYFSWAQQLWAERISTVFARAKQNSSPVFLLYTKVKGKNDFTLTGLEVDRSIMLVLLHDALFLQRHPVDMWISLGSVVYSLKTVWLLQHDCSDLLMFLYAIIQMVCEQFTSVPLKRPGALYQALELPFSHTHMWSISPLQ